MPLLVNSLIAAVIKPQLSAGTLDDH